MAKAAQSADLKRAFEKHQRETENHVTRLEEVFAALEKEATSQDLRRHSRDYG